MREIIYRKRSRAICGKQIRLEKGIIGIITPEAKSTTLHQKIFLRHYHFVRSREEWSPLICRGLPKVGWFRTSRASCVYLFVLEGRYCRTNTIGCHHSKKEQRTIKKERRLAAINDSIPSETIEFRNLWVIHTLSECVF